MQDNQEIDVDSMHRFWEIGFGISVKRLSQMIQSHTIGFNGSESEHMVRGPVKSEYVPDILSEFHHHMEQRTETERFFSSPTLNRTASHFTVGVHDTCRLLTQCDLDTRRMLNILKLATVRILEGQSVRVNGESVQGLSSCRMMFKASLLKDLEYDSFPWHQSTKDPFGNANEYNFSISGGLYGAQLDVFYRMGEIAAQFVLTTSTLDLKVGAESSPMVQAYAKEAQQRRANEQKMEEHKRLAEKKRHDKSHADWVERMTEKDKNFLDISALDAKALTALRAVSTAHEIADRTHLSLSETDKIFKNNGVAPPKRSNSLPGAKVKDKLAK